MTAPTKYRDVAEAAVCAAADRCCSTIDRDVIAAVASIGPYADRVLADKALTLDALTAELVDALPWRFPEEFAPELVFEAVARLERFGYLPRSAIR
jgi:hypothetical protein